MPRSGPQKANKTSAYRQRSGFDHTIVTLTDAVSQRRRDYLLGEYGTRGSRAVSPPDRRVGGGRGCLQILVCA